MLTNPAQTRAIYILAFATVLTSLWAIGTHAQLRHSRSAAIPDECLNRASFVDLPPYRQDACETMVEARSAFVEGDQ